MQRLILDRANFAFNRFGDETYLYDRRSRDYRLYRGIVTDMLHLLSLGSFSLAELRDALEEVARLELDELSVAVQRLAEEQILRDGSGTSQCTLTRFPVVQQWRVTRDAPFFYTPLAVNLFINGRCNQKCGFCFLDFDKMKVEDRHALSDDEWLMLTDRLIDAGIVVVNIGGMEPFLSFDLTCSILSRAHDRGCETGLITNGSVPLTDEKLERLVDLGATVGVSLESHEPSLHNDMVSTRAFNVCVQNVRRMVAAGVPVGVQMVAGRSNVSQVEEFMRWCDAELNVKSFAMQNIFGGPWCGQIDLFDVALEPSEYEAALTAARGAAPSVRMSLELDVFPHSNPDWAQRDSLPKGHVFRRFSTCSAGKTAIQVSPRGDLSPCPYTVGLQEHSVGNLTQALVLDLWHASESFGKFRSHRREDYGSSACKACEAFDVCRGGCLITANYVNGDYLAGDPRCGKVASVHTRPARRRLIPVRAD